MNERIRPVDDAASAPDSSPARQDVVYQTVTPPGTGADVGHVASKWGDAAVARHIAMGSEHSQLVEAIHATDGVSKEQAELLVTAFEKHFKDDPL